MKLQSIEKKKYDFSIRVVDSFNFQVIILGIDFEVAKSAKINV